MVGPFLSVPTGIPSVLPSSTVGDLLPADAHTNASSQATQHDSRHAISVRPGRPACGALRAPCGCAHNGLRFATGSLSGGLSMLVHYLLTRRKFEMAVGSGSNLVVNWRRAVQERAREFAARFSANKRNRDGWLWTPESRLRTGERGGRPRNRRKPLLTRRYSKILKKLSLEDVRKLPRCYIPSKNNRLPGRNGFSKRSLNSGGCKGLL